MPECTKRVVLMRLYEDQEHDRDSNHADRARSAHFDCPSPLSTHCGRDDQGPKHGWGHEASGVREERPNDSSRRDRSESAPAPLRLEPREEQEHDERNERVRCVRLELHYSCEHRREKNASCDEYSRCHGHEPELAPKEICNSHRARHEHEHDEPVTLLANTRNHAQEEGKADR